MFQGLRTVIYRVNDLARAKEWYAALVGFGPYFDEPFYVGFNVGGYELGLDPDAEGAISGDSVVTYWGVADARAALARLTELGATRARAGQGSGRRNPRRHRHETRSATSSGSSRTRTLSWGSCWRLAVSR